MCVGGGLLKLNLVFKGSIFIRVLGIWELVGGSRFLEYFRVGEISFNFNRE